MEYLQTTQGIIISCLIFLVILPYVFYKIDTSAKRDKKNNPEEEKQIKLLIEIPNKAIKINTDTYQPSEAWKKHHEKYKLVASSTESDDQDYWDERERKEEEWKDYLAYTNRHNRHYDDDESIMNNIIGGDGDRSGY
ncbi:MAG TPA: hypothetical protein VGO58_04090 [Chitinophagaceae bacterium]|jgi:hypothetical protein|nr:hypothetical protein [Chitinophagaceae bacterium]